MIEWTDGQSFGVAEVKAQGLVWYSVLRTPYGVSVENI